MPRQIAADCGGCIKYANAFYASPAKYSSVLSDRDMRRVKKSQDRVLVGTTLLIIVLAAFLALSIAFNIRSVGNKGPAAAAPQAVLPYIGSLKNISYGYLYQAGGKKQIGVVPTEVVKSVYVNASESGAAVNIDVSYAGDFSFSVYNMTRYLNSTINFYYIGFYNGTGGMHTLGNGNASRFFTENSMPAFYTPSNESPEHTIAFKLELLPTSNASGVWHFCAGFFGSYKNNTSWPAYFYNLSANRTDFYNQSMFNIISGYCPAVNVT